MHAVNFDPQVYYLGIGMAAIPEEAHSSLCFNVRKNLFIRIYEVPLKDNTGWIFWLLYLKFHNKFHNFVIASSGENWG